MAVKKKSKAIELGHTPPKGSNTGSPGGNAPIAVRVRGKVKEDLGRGEYSSPDWGTNFQDRTPPVRAVRARNNGKPVVPRYNERFENKYPKKPRKMDIKNK